MFSSREISRHGVNVIILESPSFVSVLINGGGVPLWQVVLRYLHKVPTSLPGMKFFERFKNIGIISIGVALLSVCTMVWLTASPVMSRCTGEESSDSKLYKAHPVKVVTRPWLGRHEVFGVFMVPLRFRSGKRYAGSISIQNYSGAFRPDQQPEAQRVEDVVAEPGSYLVRGYVPTRIALWFLLTGQFDELRSPCNWTLELSERSP